MSSVVFDCSKFKGLRTGAERLESFELQEVDGKAEGYAAARAKAKGGDVSTTEELIRFSIVKVNGQPVTQPYEAMDTWNARARQFLIAAYRQVNAAEDNEISDFLAGAQDADE